MKSAVALFTVSYRQALPLRRSIALAVLSLAPAGIFLFATTSRTSESVFQGAVEIGVSTYFALVLPVIAIVIAAGVLGNERRDLTLSFIALRPMSRPFIAAAKLGAATCAAVTINIVGALALGVAYLIRGGDVDFIVGLAVGTVIATAAYASIVVPLGFITDRAVIIGMAYLLVFENGAVFLLPGLASLSPWRLGVAAFGSVVPDAVIYFGSSVTASTVSISRSFLTVAIYLAVSIVITTFLLRRRDLI